MIGVGGRHGAWNGEECVQEMQPEPKGTIPTTAAKLFQPWPKRNTQEGRTLAGGGRQQVGGQEVEGHLGPARQGWETASTAHQQTQCPPGSGEGHACCWTMEALAAQGGPATCSPKVATGNQPGWDALSSPSPRHPHLAVSGAAPVGKAISSSGSRGVCQALETEIQEMDGVCARRPTRSTLYRGCPQAPVNPAAETDRPVQDPVATVPTPALTCG